MSEQTETDILASRAIEAVVMASTEPVEARLLAQLVELPVTRVEALCDDLAQEYDEADRGFVLAKVAGGYRFQTHPDLAPYVERFVLDGQHARLSGPALETLAIVAYLGPVSRPEIARIRGVAADSAVAGLLERALIEESGRGDTPGQPVLYKTTVLFERMFGLEEGLGSLPSLAEFDLPEADHEALRARLHLVADARAGQG